MHWIQPLREHVKVDSRARSVSSMGRTHPSTRVFIIRVCFIFEQGVRCERWMLHWHDVTWLFLSDTVGAPVPRIVHSEHTALETNKRINLVLSFLAATRKNDLDHSEQVDGGRPRSLEQFAADWRRIVL
ncbi:unnamed protein product [Hapterophycus canaliculatus]